MRIENSLTDDDMERVAEFAPQPPPATMLCGCYLAQLEAIDAFIDDHVAPAVRSSGGLSPRQNVVAGLFFRAAGFCKTATALKSYRYQQSLTSAERSVIELYVDIELIHRNVFLDAMDRIFAHVNWQKLKAARRMDKFFADNPALDSNPSKAASHRGFIAANGAAAEAGVAAIWGTNRAGKPNAPEHWSGMNLLERGARLDKEIEYIVVKDYDRRNFSVHTGLAGTLLMEQVHFEGMCAFALKMIADCMLRALKVIGAELQLEARMPGFAQALDILDSADSFALADAILQSIGEPARFVLFRNS